MSRICVTQQTVSLLWQHSHRHRKIGWNGWIVLMSQLQLPEKLVFSNCPQIFEYIYKHSYEFIDQKAVKKAKGRICTINKKSLLIHILLWWECMKRWHSSTASVAEHTLMVIIINHLAIPGLRVIMRNHRNFISLILCLFLYLLLIRAWNSCHLLYSKSGLFFQDC